MFFIRIMGPVMGFMMGSFFNKFYYTADRKSVHIIANKYFFKLFFKTNLKTFSFSAPRGVTPRDPMWIGMWWGGFLVIGLILFGPSLALFCFKAPEKDESDVENYDGDENGDRSTDMRNEKPTELAKERLIQTNSNECLNDIENVKKPAKK